MHNIEFKAELRDPAAARRQCALLGAEPIGTLRQTDTYFRLPGARLKKREAPGEPTEWIYYERRDLVRPRRSDYAILTDEQARRRWGSQSLRRWLKVTKTRELWMLKNVRIHLDEVERLGSFIEFEAVVSKQAGVQTCYLAINKLRKDFAMAMGEAVATSYSDLMALELEEAGTGDN